jgi:hypothetical protein
VIKQNILAGQLAKKFVFVEAVFEGLASVYKNYRNFVGELTLKFIVAVHVNLVQDKASPAMKLAQGFLDDLAQVASAS